MNCSIEGCKYKPSRLIKGLCANHYQAQYETTHPDYVNKKQQSSKAWAQSHRELYRSYHKAPKNRFHNFVNCAKRRGLEVSLSFDQWTVVVIERFCEYCGGALPEIGSGVDRKDSAKGYILGNVVPCCTVCNQIKGEDNITYEEMKYLMPLLKKFRNNALAVAAHKFR